MGTKTHSYELIFHPHTEEDQTKVVRFIKKIFLNKKYLRNFRVKIFSDTMELHCNGKNLESQISQIFLDRVDFFYKTDWLSLILLFMWVEDELI